MKTRRFKHKKTGKILSKETGSFYWYFAPDELGTTFIHEDFIEGTNDWEEIIEREYEILMYTLDGIKIRNDGSRDKSWDKICSYYSDGIKKEIYSVKRLSDGEVFTIGDKINTTAEYNVKITYIFIDSNCVFFNKRYAGCFALCDLSEKISKVKRHLFTTEDGVDIFEGDEYWIVSKEDFSLLKKVVPMSFPEKSFNFSTKESAENYIIENKPCLSFNDIKGFFSARSLNWLIDTEFKEYVKKRMFDGEISAGFNNNNPEGKTT
jgi:hypothetical protein